ncbi:MAG TPA: caspase family protein, partial [Acidimicrobiales bacterium]|nr:caspase family protein [Acidimicrobiales bacterium]
MLSGRHSRRVLFVSVLALAMLATGRLEEPALLGRSFLAQASPAPGPGAADEAPPVDPPAGVADGEVGEVAVVPPGDDLVEVAAAPAAPPPPELEAIAGTTPGDGTWAVVVGTDDYPGSRYDLGSAVADAGDVDAALARFGVPAGHRLVLRDRQASAATLRAAVDWLVANAGPDAVAVFFYAGHVRKLGPTTEALVGADGGLVPDAELAGRLSGLQARRMWVGIAGCYGGGFTELLAPGRVLTAAAGADDLAYENDRLGRSYLVEYMVRRGMLLDLAPATVQTAFLFAQTEITRDFPRRIPIMVDLLGAGLDLRQGTAAPPLPAVAGPLPAPSAPAPPGG